MSKIDKKPILSPLVEFQTEVEILQKLARSYYSTDLPINSICIDKITSKKYDCIDPTFTTTEKMVLKVLIRRAIFNFHFSQECNLLRGYYVWRRKNYEEHGERLEKNLEYFDNISKIAKKYGVLTTELIEIIKRKNKQFKPVRENIKKWKSLNTKTKNI